MARKRRRVYHNTSSKTRKKKARKKKPTHSHTHSHTHTDTLFPPHYSYAHSTSSLDDEYDEYDGEDEYEYGYEEESSSSGEKRGKRDLDRVRESVERRRSSRAKKMAKMKALKKFYQTSLHSPSLDVRGEAISQAMRATVLSSADDVVEEITTKRVGVKNALVFLVFLGRVILNPGVAVLSFLRRPERDSDVRYNFSQLVLIYLEAGILGLLVLLSLFYMGLTVSRRRKAQKRKSGPEAALAAANTQLTAFHWLLTTASFSLLKFIPSISKLGRWIQTLQQFLSWAKLKRMMLINSGTGESGVARTKSLRQRKAELDADREAGCCKTCLGNIYLMFLVISYVILGLILIVLGVLAVFIKVTALSTILDDELRDWTVVQWITLAGFINNVASLADLAEIERSAAIRVITMATFEGLKGNKDLAEWTLHTLRLSIFDSLIATRGYVVAFIIYSQLSLSRLSNAFFKPSSDIASINAQLADDRDHE